jgi:hypothetical protein
MAHEIVGRVQVSARDPQPKTLGQAAQFGPTLRDSPPTAKMGRPACEPVARRLQSWRRRRRQHICRWCRRRCRRRRRRWRLRRRRQWRRRWWWAVVSIARLCLLPSLLLAAVECVVVASCCLTRQAAVGGNLRHRKVPRPRTTSTLCRTFAVVTPTTFAVHRAQVCVARMGLW